MGNVILSLASHIPALQIDGCHTAGLEDGVKITVEHIIAPSLAVGGGRNDLMGDESSNKLFHVD